jgi:hypothetical protein
MEHKMKPFFSAHVALCCVFSLLLLETSRALDLTPHADFRHGNEGDPTPVIMVTDGTKKITFVPPHDWLPDGGGKSLSLAGPGSNGAWMKLLVVPIVKEDPQPVTDPSASPDDLQAWAKQYIPSGAQNVTFIKMTGTPFMVCMHPSTEYIFTFARYGTKATISISAVDFSATERLVVIFSAEAKDFEKVRQAAIASMFSWQYK